MNNYLPHASPTIPHADRVPDARAVSPIIEKWGVFILAVISAGMLLVALNNIDLWAPDEPRYAQVAREMAQGEEYILLRVNGEKYADKPPLYFWLVILCSKITGGINEVSVRMPSALAGVGVVLLTFALGKKLFGARAGFLAGLVLLSNVYFIIISRSAHMDLPLTLIVMLMIYAFYHAWERGACLWWTWPLFFFLGALGVMMKGPVGFLLPVMACLLFSLLRRDWRAWHWSAALGAVVFAAILSAWLLLLWQRGGDEHLRETLLGQNIGRVAGEASHDRPVAYFLGVFPGIFMPWSPLFVLALAAAFSRGWGKEKAAAAILLPAVWFAVVFVFFTAIPSKRTLYMLPLFPAAALLVGRLLDSLISGGASRRAEAFSKWLMALPLGIVALLSMIGLLVLAWFQFRGDEQTMVFIETVKRNYGAVIIFSVTLCMLGTTGASAALRKRWPGAVTAMILMGLTLGFATVFIFSPMGNNQKSARVFSEKLNETVGESEVVWYGDLREGVIYYSGRRFRVLAEAEDVAEYFSGKSARARYCAMREKYYPRIKKACREKDIDISEPIVRERVGGKTLILLKRQW